MTCGDLWMPKANALIWISPLPPLSRSCFFNNFLLNAHLLYRWQVDDHSHHPLLPATEGRVDTFYRMWITTSDTVWITVFTCFRKEDMRGCGQISSFPNSSLETEKIIYLQRSLRCVVFKTWQELIISPAFCPLKLPIVAFHYSHCKQFSTTYSFWIFFNSCLLFHWRCFSLLSI